MTDARVGKTKIFLLPIGRTRAKIRFLVIAVIPCRAADAHGLYVRYKRRKISAEYHGEQRKKAEEEYDILV